jgi:membrane protease YdiL (CAAX protease family)
MKKLIQSIPVWLQVTIYFLLLALATVVAGIVPFLNDFLFFSIIAFLTAFLFVKAGKINFKTIGAYPFNRHHWKQFFIGSAIGGSMLLATTAATVFLTGDKISFNRFDPVYLSVTVLSTLWSAYAQEFVFRGFPFHALLSKYAGWKVQLIIMIPFGLMHLNGQMDAVDMAKVMLTTGLGSLLFGLAYIKTRNLGLPVGLHFGWNYLQQHLPRVADNNTMGLITIKTTHSSYNSLMILFPYLLIIVAAILPLWIWKPGRSIPSTTV